MSPFRELPVGGRRGVIALNTVPEPNAENIRHFVCARYSTGVIETFGLAETFGLSELRKSKTARLWKIEVVPRLFALCPTVMLDRGFLFPSVGGDAHIAPSILMLNDKMNQAVDLDKLILTGR